MIAAEILNQMNFSGLAYRDVQPYYKGASPVAFSDPKTDVQFFIRCCNKRLEITFRGSNSTRDWETNFMFKKMTVPYGNTASPIRVHSGFLKAYKAPGVRDVIHRFVTENSIYTVLVSGHSQGAALAVLCSVDLEYNFPQLNYEVYLFGGPRVGNSAFRDSYNRRLLKVFRFENGNDIVTKMPLAIMGYRHVGIKLHVGFLRLPFVFSYNDHYPQAYYRNILCSIPRGFR